MSIGLDQGQDRRYINFCPDLSQNCLQRLSADGKVAASNKRRVLCVIAVSRWLQLALLR